MEYQELSNLLDDASNKISKFRTKNWVERNDESKRTYDVGDEIKCKTTMLKSSLCDYSDTYMHVRGIITVNNTVAEGAAANNSNIKVIFKTCAPFTNLLHLLHYYLHKSN